MSTPATRKIEELQERAKTVLFIDPGAAIKLLSKALALCSPADVEPYARCLSRLAYAHALKGERGVAYGKIGEAMDLLRDRRYRETLNSIRGTAASIYGMTGEVEQALATYARALRHVAKGSLPEADIHLGIGIILCDCGRFIESVERVLRAIEIYEVNKVLPNVATFGSLSMTYAELGDLRNARNYLKRAAHVVAQTGDRINVCNLEMCYGSLAERQNKSDVALRHYLKSARLAKRLGLHRSQAEAYSRAAVCVSKSHSKRAMSYAIEARTSAQEVGAPLLIQGCMFRLAQVYVVANQREQAIATLLEGLTVQSEPAPILIDMHSLLGDLYAQQGEFKLARSHAVFALRLRERMDRVFRTRSIAAQKQLAKLRHEGGKIQRLAQGAKTNQKEITTLLHQIEDQRRVIRELQSRISIESRRAAIGSGASTTEQVQASTKVLHSYRDQHLDSILALHPNLSVSEAHVAGHLRIGLPTKEIATLLGMSPRTVEWHRSNIRAKLGVARGHSLVSALRKKPAAINGKLARKDRSPYEPA